MSKKVEVILVDVGNSAVKTTEVFDGVFSEEVIFSDLNAALERYAGNPLMISSVKKVDINQLQSDDIKILSHQTPMPITLDYATPETLGADRIAAAVGANELFPTKDNIVVDLGTCMTIDFIDKSKVFRGGVISPGLKMRMSSMANNTDGLPDISADWTSYTSGQLGKSTKECLLSGSFWAIIHEINGFYRALEEDFTSLNMIITGGDAHYFESKLKAHIFAGSKIVQKGLYRIWKY